MCLFLEKNQIKIAEQDIPCIKILYDENGKLFAPFQPFIYQIGKTYSQYGGLTLNSCSFKNINASYFAEYGFHSYKIGVKGIDMFRYGNIHKKIFECIIPKGAEYCEGFHWTMATNSITDAKVFEQGYVSSQIKIIKEYKK